MTTKPSANHPFAKLQALRTVEPQPGAAAPATSSAGPPPPTPPAPATPAAAPKGPAWAVVRLERKGRAGKEATIVEKLALPPAELARWCKDLKQALGCGGVVEGDSIVLQGDLRSRLSAVLTKRGVRKVTVS